MLKFEPIEKENAADRIARTIRGRIFSGDLGPGEKLPPERELARAFGVNRTTLREAIKKLELLRLVSVRQGDGITVLDYRRRAGFDLIPFLLQSVLQGEGRGGEKLLADMLEARKGVLAELMGIAARKIRKKQVARLRTLLEEIDAAGADPADLVDLDMEFHERVIEIADNDVVGLAYNTLRRLYENNRDFFVSNYAGRERSLAMYRGMIERLSARDEEGCREFYRRWTGEMDAIFLKRLAREKKGRKA